MENKTPETATEELVIKTTENGIKLVDRLPLIKADELEQAIWRSISANINTNFDEVDDFYKTMLTLYPREVIEKFIGQDLTGIAGDKDTDPDLAMAFALERIMFQAVQRVAERAIATFKKKYILERKKEKEQEESEDLPNVY